MPSVRRFFELAPRYTSRFGVLRGTDVLLRTIVAKALPRGAIVSVRLPGLAAPVGIRARTSDVKVFFQVFIDREHDVKWPKSDVAVIIDAGANVGYSSVFFASQYPSATVIAIEPEPGNYRQLVENTKAYSNVKPVNAALLNEPGRVSISDPTAEEWAFRVDGSKKGGVDVEAVAIPQLLHRFGLTHVDILKIDVEGSEIEIFDTGSASWLNKVDNLMIELHDYLRPGCEAAVSKALGPSAFDRSSRGEFVLFSRRS